jgi:hypothetical protein
MIANSVQPVTSVTPFDKKEFFNRHPDLDPAKVTFYEGSLPSQYNLTRFFAAHNALTAAPGFDKWSKHCISALSVALGQKRLDMSASSEKVRWLS